MEVDQIHSQIEQKKKRLKTMQIAVPRDWSQFIRTCGGRRNFDVFEMQLHRFKDLTALYKKKYAPFVARKKINKKNILKYLNVSGCKLDKSSPASCFTKTLLRRIFPKYRLFGMHSKRLLPRKFTNIKIETYIDGKIQ